MYPLCQVQNPDKWGCVMKGVRTIKNERTKVKFNNTPNSCYAKGSMTGLIALKMSDYSKNRATALLRPAIFPEVEHEIPPTSGQQHLMSK